MIRNYLKGDKMVSEHGFRYRGISSSRLEGLTFAVIGLSVFFYISGIRIHFESMCYVYLRKHEP